MSAIKVIPQSIVKEIAPQINDNVNIPLPSEETEQVIFETITKIVLNVYDYIYKNFLKK